MYKELMILSFQNHKIAIWTPKYIKITNVKYTSKLSEVSTLGHVLTREEGAFVQDNTKYN